MPKIIQNAIHLTHEDVFLCSTHRHDFHSHICKNGEVVFVDGGNDYLRWGGIDKVGYSDFTLYEDSPFKDKLMKKLWGSRGKDGKSPLKYSPLWLLETSHLLKIKELTYVSEDTIKIIDHILLGDQIFKESYLAIRGNPKPQ